VKLGKQERYFKDDHERAQFMLAQALVGASLLPKKGGQAIEGKTLEDLAKTYLFGEAIVARLPGSSTPRPWPRSCVV